MDAAIMVVIHGLVVFLYVFSTGYVSGLDCGNNALGMQHNVIPADKITASSGTAGDRARLNYTTGASWCAMGNDENPYLQIDLGTPHIICAVATQGGHQGGHWVKTFYLNSSDDGKTYYPYKKDDKIQQIFYGNVDGSGIVKQILYQGIIARYLRILPMMYHGAACIRAEIYGVKIQSKNLALNKKAEQSSTDHDGTASRAVDGIRDNTWLGGSCTHCGQRDNQPEWWLVDLGVSVEVEEVTVFTRSHPEYGLRLWNYTFELHIGTSKSDDAFSRSKTRCGDQYGIIPSGSITIVCDPPMNGRYVIILQKQHHQQLSLCEVEVYGQENPVHKITLGQEPVDVETCNNVASEASKEWLIVDLGQSIPVYRIEIHAKHNYGDIFTVFGIHIGNNGLTDGASTDPIIIGRAKNSWPRYSIVLNSIMIGRYLTFKRIGPTSNLAHEFCQVEVYSRVPVCERQSISISNSRVVPDSRLSASSIYSNSKSAAQARLFGDSSWRPRDDDVNPWLQVDLGEIYYVCAVATQGDPNTDERTTAYEITGSADHQRWVTVKSKVTTEKVVFVGNKDKSTSIKNTLPRPLTARVVRFYPVEKNQAHALRVEIYGVIKEPAAPVPPQIGKMSLYSSLGSHVDLVCRADKGLKIKWYHNDTDITSYSSSTVRKGSVLESTLRVNYTSADDVYDKYSCDEGERICTSMDYICQVDFGSFRKLQSRGKVTTIPVPTRPRNLNATVNPQNGNNRPTVTLKWKKPVKTIGRISSYSLFYNYVIEDNRNTKSLVIADFTSMTYTIDVTGGSYVELYLKAKANGLNGDPSETWTANIQECKPSSAPANINVTKSDKGKYKVSWQEIPRELSNGKVIAYEVKWSSLVARRSRRSPVATNAANVSQSPCMLLNISLTESIKYDVIVRGYTKAGPGPFSSPFVLQKLKAEGHNQDDQGSGSLIAVAVLFPLFVIFALGVALFLFWYKKRQGEDIVIFGRTIRRISSKYSPRNPEEDEEIYLTPVDGHKRQENQEQNTEIEEVECDAIYENKTGKIAISQFPDFMARTRRKKHELLMHQYKALPHGRLYPCTVAAKPTNKSKNRYSNIIPYDNSRVILEKLEGNEDSDYINASYIRGYDCKKISYIATQGPLSQTVDDFWRMIWQEKSSVIVMLTGIKEHNKTKCEKYWPESSRTYQHLSVHLLKTEVFADYCIRTFVLSKMETREQRYVFQYHFTAWPDKGVPHYSTQLLIFRRRLATDTAMGSPWVVHCSAGVGRTGAFIAIDAMIRQAREHKAIDVADFVKTMRQNRQNMVQTKEQYLFIHMAILEHLTCGITEIPAQQLRKKINKLTINDRKEKITGFEKEFKSLSCLCPDVHKDEMKHGSKTCNSKRNRFQHILPLDNTRVILHNEETDKEGTDYINASYVNGYRQKDAYILTQTPLDNTIADFWKMIYDNKVGTIVMLNNLQEGNVSYPIYWPEKGSLEFGNITVEIIEVETENSIVSREFNLTHLSDNPNRKHKVSHLQHTEWSDGFVPTTSASVLNLVEKIQESQRQSANKPIVVQCSDGVGRSGTLCTILSLLDRVKTEQMVDVFQTVKAMRISRPGAVETAIQYQVCFQVVMDYLESFSDYSNFNG